MRLLLFFCSHFSILFFYFLYLFLFCLNLKIRICLKKAYIYSKFGFDTISCYNFTAVEILKFGFTISKVFKLFEATV